MAVAGEPGRVTVATAMAGRGTDIKLSDAVKQAGGLHVLSTTRGEAGRVDRQLYGRCGRQGDPGSYQCVDSLEDEAFVAAVPEAVRRALRPLASRDGGLAQRVCVAFVTFVQRRNEARCERQRTAMLREEERLERALAFSGAAE